MPTGEFRLVLSLLFSFLFFSFFFFVQTITTHFFSTSILDIHFLKKKTNKQVCVYGFQTAA